MGIRDKFHDVIRSKVQNSPNVQPMDILGTLS